MVIVAIADLHTGSAYAPFPAKFTNSWGALVSLNDTQRYLLKCFEDFKKRVPKKFDVLILNGDLIHGKNPKESGAEVCERSPEWQQRAALEMLESLAFRAREVYATRGSAYHIGEAGIWEEQLLRCLGAVPDRIGRCARPWLNLNVRGIRLDVAHRQSVAIRYLSSPLERELQFAMGRTQAERKPPPDVVIRAHVHTYKWLDIDGLPLGLSLPAWQAQGTYVQTSISPNRKRSLWAGAVVLTLHPKRKKKGVQWPGAYVERELICYPMPAVEMASYPA